MRQDFVYCSDGTFTLNLAPGNSYDIGLVCLTQEFRVTMQGAFDHVGVYVSGYKLARQNYNSSGNGVYYLSANLYCGNYTLEAY